MKCQLKPATNKSGVAGVGCCTVTGKLRVDRLRSLPANLDMAAFHHYAPLMGVEAPEDLLKTIRFDYDDWENAVSFAYASRIIARYSESHGSDDGAPRDWVPYTFPLPEYLRPERPEKVVTMAPRQSPGRNISWSTSYAAWVISFKFNGTMVLVGKYPEDGPSPAAIDAMLCAVRDASIAAFHDATARGLSHKGATRLALDAADDEEYRIRGIWYLEELAAKWKRRVARDRAARGMRAAA
jgi:hypothetical protein